MVPRLLLPMTLLAAFVATDLHAGCACDEGGCKPACCACEVKWVCCPKYEKEKIEKHCFQVECEHICVPKVKLPWQSCCTPRCARVLCVHKLKKHTYECGEKCVIKWEAKPVCVRCCKPGCGYGPTQCCQPAPCADPAEYPSPAGLPAAGELLPLPAAAP